MHCLESQDDWRFTWRESRPRFERVWWHGRAQYVRQAQETLTSFRSSPCLCFAIDEFDIQWLIFNGWGENQGGAYIIVSYFCSAGRMSVSQLAAIGDDSKGSRLYSRLSQGCPERVNAHTRCCKRFKAA